MTATATMLATATIVTAQPWKQGELLPADHGVIVRPTWGESGEFAIVMFPRQNSVQAIERRLITKVNLPSAAFARRAYQMAKTRHDVPKVVAAEMQRRGR